jgi:hypothetical protein
MTFPVAVTAHAVDRARERIGMGGLDTGSVRRRIRLDVVEALDAGRVSTLVPEEVARGREDLERPPSGCWYAWRPGRDRFYVLRLDGSRWVVATVIVPAPGRAAGEEAA